MSSTYDLDMAAYRKSRIAEVWLYDSTECDRVKHYVPEWANLPPELAQGVQVHFDGGRGYPSAVRVLTKKGWRYLEPSGKTNCGSQTYELGGAPRDLAYVVLLAFLGYPPMFGGRTAACRVKNGADCCVENLYWGTPIDGALSTFVI